MKQYRNAERTRQRIRKAFTELIAEKKSIEKITVNELSERAEITKTTFYYHYDDIYSVAEEFENELIAELSETLEVIEKENPEDYSEYLGKILSFIKQNEESYRLAANATDLAIFASKLKTIISKRMLNMSAGWNFSPVYEKRAVQIYFLGSACVDTVVQYLKGNFGSSIDLIGEVITEAIDKLNK